MSEQTRFLEGACPLGTPVAGGRGRAGVGLVEVLLGLVILVAAVILLVQLGARYRAHERTRLLAGELLRMEAAFQQYYRKYRTAPPNSGVPGGVPAGMELQLGNTIWTDGSAYGGHYVWYSPSPAIWTPKPETAGETPLGAIMLSAFAPDAPLVYGPQQEKALRALLSENPQFHGKLGTGFNGWPLLVVYPRP